MSTHALSLDGDLLTKRYTSWDRGEHRREWAALRTIHLHAPGLAPRPVSCDLDAEPPSLTMTVVPGQPLAGRLGPRETDALVTAVQRLWAVPSGGPWRDDLDFARRLTDSPRPTDPPAGQAYDAALRWWDGPDPVLLRREPETTVLGHGDPNLANYLWDGSRVRLVDFEDSRRSDPANEVAMLLEHLSTRDSGLHPGHFDVDPVRLLAARRRWAMFWLWLLLPGGPSAHRNPPGTADLQARRLLRLLTEPAAVD